MMNRDIALQELADAKALSAELGYVTIQEQFCRFHIDNLDVYDSLASLSRELTSRGYAKTSIKLLFNILRWNKMLETTVGDDEFKLNDKYHSRYGRLLMKYEEDLDGLFDLRAIQRM